MKNIHVLPTDKPSRLFITDGKLFNYHKPQQGDGVKIINVNIYITNSEEIKDGDYGLVVNEILSYNKMIELWGLTQGWKIILTTDQDLIKDGVQAIDDDFLEWFVKNPSCESVEVEVSCGVCHSNDSECWRSKECSRGTYDDIYKTVISKEENIHDEYLKDDTLEVFINRCINSGKYIDGVLNLKQKQILEIEDILGRYNDSKAKTKIRKILETKQETQCYICPQTKKQCDDECCVSAEDCHIEASMGLLSEPKQETLEEAAEVYSKRSSASVFQENHKKDFIAGAKWQQERMYSKEDLEVAYFEGKEGLYSFNDWIKQFKNK